MSPPSSPFLYQINVSQGGVPKLPVENARVSWLGIIGDGQRNTALHGGKDRALLLFSSDLIEALRNEGHSISAGSTGENLTISGLDWTHLQPGDELKIGSDLRIEITSYAEPCRYIGKWFVDDNFNRISQKAFPGWSRLCAKVLSEGSVRQGDVIYINGESTARAS